MRTWIMTLASLASATLANGSALAVEIVPVSPPPAGTLPPVEFYDSSIGVPGYGPYPITGPGEVAVPAGAASGTAHAIADLQPSPLIYMDFSNTQFVGGEAGGGGAIDMTYYAMYYNPALPLNYGLNPQVNVALLVDDFLATTGVGLARAQLTLSGYFTDSTGTLTAGTLITDQQCMSLVQSCREFGDSELFPPLEGFQMVENTKYTINLLIYEEGGYSTQYGIGGAVAKIDPIISIDPSSDDAGGALFFSAGVGNGAVPEPSTWAMLLAGFAALGLAYRARRRRFDPSPAAR